MLMQHDLSWMVMLGAVAGLLALVFAAGLVLVIVGLAKQRKGLWIGGAVMMAGSLAASVAAGAAVLILAA